MMAGAGGAMRATGWRATAIGANNSVNLVPALTWFAALTRAREAGRRDAIFNLLDPLDGPGRCGGSRPRLRW